MSSAQEGSESEESQSLSQHCADEMGDIAGAALPRRVKNAERSHVQALVHRIRLWGAGRNEILPGEDANADGSKSGNNLRVEVWSFFPGGARTGVCAESASPQAAAGGYGTWCVRPTRWARL